MVLDSKYKKLFYILARLQKKIVEKSIWVLLVLSKTNTFAKENFLFVKIL